VQGGGEVDLRRETRDPRPIRGSGLDRTQVRVERARVEDVPQIYELVSTFARRGETLHRPLGEIYETLRDFIVARRGYLVLGCVALHVNWADLAELKAVAVREDSQHQGIGGRLCRAALRDARRLGVAVVYALSYRPTFFERFGFRRVDSARLPRQVWGECYRCPKFNCCDEVPLICEVSPVPAGWADSFRPPLDFREPSGAPRVE